MNKEEVEILPSGVVTCMLNGREVNIVKVSPEKITIRISEEVKEVKKLLLAFYIFDKCRYEEVAVYDYKVISKIEKEFYYTYTFTVSGDDYRKNVKDVFNRYFKYVMLKNCGEDNEFSREMVDYPAELDYDFYNLYIDQKKDWVSNLNYEEFDERITSFVELAISLDNEDLYNSYLSKDFKTFYKDYLKDNFIENHKLFKEGFSRLYVGNEFCHNLFPRDEVLIKILEKAKKENLKITLCFTYIRDLYIERNKELLDRVYSWARNIDIKIEIVINDWGMIELLNDKLDYLEPTLGILLNKRRKDPRILYKKGVKENKELMSENSTNCLSYTKFLRKNNISRFEYETCGYEIKVPEGKHSLHLPFYQTNTSQFCPLYAMCTFQDRGNQKLVTSCPRYCRDYVFAYPKHLKMVGLYNSLFGFDDTVLKDAEKLKYYIEKGIDRLVLNFK